MKMREILSIALFASAWGLIETLIGGAMHMAHLPFTGVVMASIGFAILYTALRSGLAPSKLALVSIVAASFKFLHTPLFGTPLFDPMIINPAISIASQGLVFALIVHFCGLESHASERGNEGLEVRIKK